VYDNAMFGHEKQNGGFTMKITAILFGQAVRPSIDQYGTGATAFMAAAINVYTA